MLHSHGDTDNPLCEIWQVENGDHFNSMTFGYNSMEITYLSATTAFGHEFELG